MSQPHHRVLGMTAVRCLVSVGLVTGCTSSGPEATSNSAPSDEIPTSAATPDPVAESEIESEQAQEPALARLPDIVPEPWQPSTRSEQLAVSIGEVEEVTPQMAIDIIGLMLPDLPGQTPTDLARGDGLGDYIPVQLAHTMGDRFSEAQRAVIDEFLDAGVLAATITPDGTMVIAEQPGSIEGPEGFRRRRIEPFEQYPIILEGVLNRWDAHLPDHPAVTVEMEIVPLGKPNPENGLMDAYVSDGVCEIRVWPSLWADVNLATPGWIAFIFAHEVFHCYQGAWQGGGPSPNPGWMIEGGADWAAADLYRSQPTSAALDPAWFDHAKLKSLEGRGYDAWPLWENAHDMGRDVYGAMKAMVPSPNKAISERLHAGGLDGQVFRRNWDTTSYQQSIWGDPWFLSWPEGDAPAAPNTPEVIDGGGVGERIIFGQGDYVHAPFFVDMHDVELVTVTPMHGPFTTHTSIGTVTVEEGSTGYFCFADHRCACPDETPGGIAMTSTLMMFSFAVDDEAGRASVRTEKWDDDKCDRPTPNPAAHSNGDPHLRTFDGLPYDVMTLGEFVIARDPEGDLEVQTRHEPIGAGAGTTAVAIGTGGHRLTFTMPALDSQVAPIARLDGEVIDAAQVDVGDAHAAVAGLTPSIWWPDGTVVELRWFYGWFVSIETNQERAGRMVGLLGSADGDFANDLPLPDGTLVDTSDAARDESPFVLQWAVDEATTLFDYAPGESAATFRVPHPGFVDLEFSPTAIVTCTEALGPLALSEELDSCAFDVSATGDDGYVTIYTELVEDRITNDPDFIVIPDEAPTTQPTDGASSRSGEPTITLGGETLEGTIEAVAGSVLLAKVELCPEGEVIDIVVTRATDDGPLARVTVCEPGAGGSIGADDDDEWFNGEAYVWLPDDGIYEIIVAPVRFGISFGAVDFYTDPTPTIVSAADIGTGGDQQTLEGIGDTVVYLTDPHLDYATDGLQSVCAVEVWSGRDFPDPQPFDLVRCEHTDTIHFPPTDQTVPLVVFARTDQRVEVSLTPT